MLLFSALTLSTVEAANVLFSCYLYSEKGSGPVHFVSLYCSPGRLTLSEVLLGRWGQIPTEENTHVKRAPGSPSGENSEHCLQGPRFNPWSGN